MPSFWKIGSKHSVKLTHGAYASQRAAASAGPSRQVHPSCATCASNTRMLSPALRRKGQVPPHGWTVCHIYRRSPRMCALIASRRKRPKHPSRAYRRDEVQGTSSARRNIQIQMTARISCTGFRLCLFGLSGENARAHPPCLQCVPERGGIRRCLRGERFKSDAVMRINFILAS